MDKELIKEMRKASKGGDLDRIIELVENNDELLYTKTAFGTWLNDAVKSGENAVVQYFIEKSLDVNYMDDILGYTPITQAASAGFKNIVEILYNNGAILDVSNFTNNSLFAAIYGGHLDVVKYLVEQGIDITASYSFGELDNVDAYEYARQYGQTEIASYLKEKLEETQEK